MITRVRIICGGCGVDGYAERRGTVWRCPDCGWTSQSVAKRGPHPKLRAPIDLARAHQLYHGQGLSFDAVAAHLGCTPHAIERAFRRAGIPVRTRTAWRVGMRQALCKRGHPLDGDNVQHYPDGRRGCRTCARNKARERARRRREVVVA